MKMAYQRLLDQIVEEYERHRYVLQSDKLLAINRDKFTRIMERRVQPPEYAAALEYLVACLKKYYNKNVILLDEYGVPLENAHIKWV